jgi:putative DNA methylase
VITETQSATKKGKYVQGTMLLVLRKRKDKRNGRRMDIEGEIEDEVGSQLRSLNAIDEGWQAEKLYTDGDLQLAAYAAALRVITSYETVDKQDVGADVFRKLKKGEKTVIRELIEYAASVANNLLVPDGFSSSHWRDLDPASRFYVRMLDMEDKGFSKFADFENFAKTFALASYRDLMGSTQANKASLAGAHQLKGKIMEAGGFGQTPLRRILFAVYKTMQEDDPKVGLTFLKTELGQDYWTIRLTLADLAGYLSAKTARTRPDESAAANLVAEALHVDRL